MRRPPPPEIIGLLDIGTAKVCCAIVERTMVDGLPNGDPAALRVLGFAQLKSEGVRGGMIVDLDRAEDSVSRVVGEAERLAAVRLEDVSVAVSNARLRSEYLTARSDLAAGRVRSQDLHRLSKTAAEYAGRDGREIIHLSDALYTIDEDVGIRAPLDMIGSTIACQFHVVTADPAPLRNTIALLGRCYLGAKDFALGAWMSACAATTEEERQSGVLCIDIGAGATKLAVVAEGRLIFADTLAVGGANLTHDVAVMLTAPLAEAERIKTLYGTLSSERFAPNATISDWRASEGEFIAFKAHRGDRQETTRAELAQTLYPRARRQLEMVDERLSRSRIARRLAKSVVLTGGGSELVGLASLASEVLGMPVRTGQPSAFDGGDQVLTSPAMATIVGMAHAGRSSKRDMVANVLWDEAQSSYLGRMERWLRESF